MRGNTALALILGTLLSGASGHAQEGADVVVDVTKSAVEEEAPAGSEPTFGGEVELVTVDVVVVDDDGNPVTGLSVEDFTILEEGVPQEVSSFEAVAPEDAPPVEAAPTRARVATNMDPESRSSRSFLILYDDVHLPMENALKAKSAVAAFLQEGVREGDFVSLLSTSGAAWWSTRMEAGRDDLLAILERLEAQRLPEDRFDQMSDWEAMRIHTLNDSLVAQRVYRRFQMLRLTPESAMASDRIERERASRAERDNLYSRGINDLLVESRASESYRQVRSRSDVTLRALERALESLRGARGRKAMILVSDGFVFDTTNDRFKDVAESARRSNVAIYFLNTRGLEGLDSLYGAGLGVPIQSGDMGPVMADVTQEAAGSEHLAEATGGFTIRNTNDLVGGIQRIARESESYYLLGYTPKDAPRDGSYRRLKVELRQGDYTIRARQGYYAPNDATTAEREPEDADIQRALDSPYFNDELPVRMSAYVREEKLLGRARTLLALEVDITDLAYAEQAEDGKPLGVLDLLYVVAHRDGGDVLREDQQVEIVRNPAVEGTGGPTWYALAREFSLEPGWHQAKVVVRDPNGGRVGSVALELDVPELEGFRVSTPIVTDRLTRRDAQSPPIPAIMARRSFAAGGALFCQFDVYGATKGQITGLPQVSAAYSLVSADGIELRREDATLIQPTSLGYVSRLWAVLVGDVPPGDYELVITVKDEIAEHTEVLREPVVLSDQVQVSSSK
jgi:VWFA-related protein